MLPELKEKPHHFFYTIHVRQLLKDLKTDGELGLVQEEALRRLEDFGKNKLPEPEKISVLKILLKQLTSFMIYILLGATFLSIFLGDIGDAFLIGIVIIANTFIGFFQEYKAEKTLASLKKLASPTAKVVRDGQIEEINSENVVVGDIVVLEVGDMIPSDLRLLETVGLSINESILTGESLPSKKDSEITIEEKVSIGDRLNMAFMGTVVVTGNGRGVVVSTGAATQIGNIATTLAIPYEKPTPLQKNLTSLGRILVITATISSALIFLIGILQNRNIEELLFTVINLGVAVIPEGLVAVVTITMALGVQRMAKRNAIVRNLPSVETLGAVNVICSDKTGTLTEGKMVATDLWAGDKLYTVSGSGVTPEGTIYCDDKRVSNFSSDLNLSLTTMSLCNDAILQNNNDGGWEAVGDPTEIALQVLAHKLGFEKNKLEESYIFQEGLPFDSDRKRMSVLYKNKEGETIVFTKGAASEILSICHHVLKDEKIIPMDGKREKYEEIDNDMSGRGLRVLAFSYKKIAHPTENIEPSTIEHSMTFLGLVGVLDPVRSEVKDAVNSCHKAGIKILMVTGDHPATATNVAIQLGIFDPGEDTIITGEEIDKAGNDFSKLKTFPKIFARVSPENKLSLVNYLRQINYVVAMTGDGVNDASAIKHANVGIAMGKEGTDITKQAADIILADDNFATIVVAIEEGRRIFTNILKFVRYLISCNLSTVSAILLATIFGIPIPFTAGQILWLNLVTDTPPALALGFDKKEEDAMQNPPRNTKNGLLRKRDILFISYHAIVMATIMLFVFLVEVYIGNGSLQKARTMAFAMLVIVQLVQSFNAKSTRSTILRMGTINNKYLLIGVGISFGLLLIGIYLPILSHYLGQVSLSFIDWLKLLSGALVFLSFAEAYKFASRRL